MNAIEFDHVGKQYRLGLVSTGTFSHDLNRWWMMNVRHKEDPNLKIGETNDRSCKGESNYVWALKDINFNVEQGDVVGIIGKNGAGKSTLLKLLSRVTTPTVGEIRARGRIASLLEVGTGFHPEMTGRENIYMNGAIMGMTKAEISRKLDEIVDFSGCERYIDTPVKRYSSGMTVRLGFAIAAHLEPEILVVDEVLAVGDAEFQKKAIGKMQDISKAGGRTVLFVSHNTNAIKNLCKRGIVLEKGMQVYDSTAIDAVDYYLHKERNTYKFDNKEIKDRVQDLAPYLSINSISFNGSTKCESTIVCNQKYIDICVEGTTKAPIETDFSFTIRNKEEVPIAAYGIGHATGKSESIQPGKFKIERRVVLPRFVNSGECFIDMALHQPGIVMHMYAPSCVKVTFEGGMEAFGRANTIETNGFFSMESI